MEKIRHIIEVLTGDHGLLSHLSFISVALLSLKHGQGYQEPEILGDNVPYTITDKIRLSRPRG